MRLYYFAQIIPITRANFYSRLYKLDDTTLENYFFTYKLKISYNRSMLSHQGPRFVIYSQIMKQRSCSYIYIERERKRERGGAEEKLGIYLYNKQLYYIKRLILIFKNKQQNKQTQNSKFTQYGHHFYSIIVLICFRND